MAYTYFLECIDSEMKKGGGKINTHNIKKIINDDYVNRCVGTRI